MDSTKHDYTKSGFFNRKSKKKVCELLYITEETVQKIISDKKRFYRERAEEKRNLEIPLGKHAQSPKTVYNIHKRIADLFSRIAMPEYVHSSRKGRSYITNAEAHIHSGVLGKMDISKFYENTTQKHAEEFFLHYMRCSPGVAAMLADLVTYNGHLPTGSPLSPIMSFFIHKRTFDKIYAKAQSQGITMSLWIDDITFSGNGSKKILWEATKELRAIGLTVNAKKNRLYQAGQAREVTGVVMKNGNKLLRNRTLKKIHEGFQDMEKLKKNGEEELLEKQKKSMRGVLYEASHFNYPIQPLIEKLDRY